MSERLRTGTHTVARGDRVVLRRTDIRSKLVKRSGSRPLLDKILFVHCFCTKIIS